MQALISVIVPVYKVQQYIRKCIDSVVGQSYQNLEIILVDDGSPDDCGRICDEYAQKDARVKVIHQANRGLSGARNAGLAVAQGDYVAFVDPDDYILKDMYADLLRLALKHGAAVVVSDFYETTKSASKRVCLKNNSAEFLNKLAIEDVRRLTLLDRLPHCVWNRLYAANIAKNMRFPDIYGVEDMLFNDQIVFRTDRVVFSDKSHYCYNLQNTGSITALTEDEGKIARARYGLFVAWRARESLAAGGALSCPQEVERFSRLNVLHHAMKTIVSLQGMGLDGYKEAKKQDCLEYLRENEKVAGLSGLRMKYKLLWWCHENCRALFRAYAKVSLYLRNFKNKTKLGRQNIDKIY
ncbi:MAG: glycosyltransferase [Acidaminococcales bacterium]|nr:glycosyltransferase [Acidaminococcales bacterium]